MATFDIISPKKGKVSAASSQQKNDGFWNRSNHIQNISNLLKGLHRMRKNNFTIAGKSDGRRGEINISKTNQRRFVFVSCLLGLFVFLLKLDPLRRPSVGFFGFVLVFFFLDHCGRASVWLKSVQALLVMPSRPRGWSTTLNNSNSSWLETKKQRPRANCANQVDGLFSRKVSIAGLPVNTSKHNTCLRLSYAFSCLQRSHVYTTTYTFQQNKTLLIPEIRAKMAKGLRLRINKQIKHNTTKI